MAQPALSTPPYVQADVNYLVNTGERPVNYASVAGVRGEQRGGSYAQHSVAIHDGRAAAAPTSLDREGFALVQHNSQVNDLYDQDEVVRVYEAELEALVKAATGAASVKVFDHTWRADSEAMREAKVVREPGRTMHNDHTPRSARQRLRDEIGEEAAAPLLERRFAIINVWRPIAEVLTAPLALCDARSIAPEDLIATERRSPHRVGEIYQLTYSPAHRWYYFPRMQPDEVILIKVFDAATDGRARFAAHGAFDDPTTPADAPPRQSIESRTFAFF